MKLEAELQKVCDGILAPMDKNLIPSASTEESEVFYHEMKGDYNGHFAEFATCDAENHIAEDARVACAGSLSSNVRSFKIQMRRARRYALLSRMRRLVQRRPSVRVKARITDCDVLVRIDKQSPNIAGGVDVGKDDLDDGAGLRHARDETQATVQHHVDLSVVVQRRVRPQSKESSKTVEVPQVQCIDKVTDVPVVVQRQVPVIQTVEKAESNPAGSKADVTWTTEAVTLGDGPSMFETTPEQHMFAVTYADEVAKHINKIVDVPVVSQRQAPNIQTETAESPSNSVS